MASADVKVNEVKLIMKEAMMRQDGGFNEYEEGI